MVQLRPQRTLFTLNCPDHLWSKGRIFAKLQVTYRDFANAINRFSHGNISKVEFPRSKVEDVLNRHCAGDLMKRVWQPAVFVGIRK